MTPGDAWLTARTLVETFGWTGLRLRTQFEARRLVGAFHAAPSQGLHSLVPIPASWPFSVDLDRLAAAVDEPIALARADRVAAGEHERYRSDWYPLPRDVAEWTTHPTTGFEYPQNPWYAVHHLAAAMDPSVGDVKDVWEPARFGWVFDLIRGYALSRDVRYVDAFARHLDAFTTSSPPFRGVQWICGQESAIRALSCLWAEAAFGDRLDAARRFTLQTLLIGSADRISDAIEYGVSQRNNHGISEAAGLIALGARFQGRHPEAGSWLREGRRWLDHCVVDQIADDGWYTQHSFTYLRVALDQIVVAQRALLAADGRGLSELALSRIASAVRLLFDVHDPDTGDVPNHGANDGAFVLGITTSGYRDFRPTLTASAATFHIALDADFCPVREVLAWLGANEPPRLEEPRSNINVGASGWVSARCGRIRVFARAGEYESRPSHIDPVHVDVWIDGVPVALDAGTFRYCAAPPWRNALSAIEVHNTVSIPSLPAAVRGPRFLWLSRPSARVVGWRSLGSGGASIELRNDSWTRNGVSHRRLLELQPTRLVVTDEIRSREPIDAVLQWLVPDSVPQPIVSASTAATTDVVRASDTDVFGWVSPEYARKLPAVSLQVRASTAGLAPHAALRFVTTFCVPADAAT